MVWTKEDQRQYRIKNKERLNKYQNAWRRAHRDQRNAATTRCRKRKKEWLDEYKAQHGCMDCGEPDPVVLEFDHLADKSFTIGNVRRFTSYAKLEQEMAKCQVVCANCHRRRTFQRGYLPNGTSS